MTTRVFFEVCHLEVPLCDHYQLLVFPHCYRADCDHNIINIIFRMLVVPPMSNRLICHYVKQYAETWQFRDNWFIVPFLLFLSLLLFSLSFCSLSPLFIFWCYRSGFKLYFAKYHLADGWAAASFNIWCMTFMFESWIWATFTHSDSVISVVIGSNSRRALIFHRVGK